MDIYQWPDAESEMTTIAGSIATPQEPERLGPEDWLSSLDFSDRLGLVESPSLHLDYKEATCEPNVCEICAYREQTLRIFLVRGHNGGSAITGGTSHGFSDFDPGPHSWKPEDIEGPRAAFSVLHANLCHNLALSSIEPPRVKKIIDSLRYDVLKVMPQSMRRDYSTHQMMPLKMSYTTRVIRKRHCPLTEPLTNFTMNALL